MTLVYCVHLYETVQTRLHGSTSNRGGGPRRVDIHASGTDAVIADEMGWTKPSKATSPAPRQSARRPGIGTIRSGWANKYSYQLWGRKPYHYLSVLWHFGGRLTLRAKARKRRARRTGRRPPRAGRRMKGLAPGWGGCNMRASSRSEAGVLEGTWSRGKKGCDGTAKRRGDDPRCL
jgi:hypothetical protein